MNVGFKGLCNEGQNPRPQGIPFQSDFEILMEGNKKLRERVFSSGKSKEEEPQFSTPNGEQKEAETTTRRLQDPQRLKLKRHDIPEVES